MKRSDPQVLAKVILHAAQNALGVPHLAVSDCICSFSRDTRKIIRVIEAVKADTGLEMSLTSFAGSANIAQMGEVLAQGRTPAPLVVELKRGEGTPLFMVPGISSAVVELLDLAQAIETDGPIYALAFPGLDGLEKPIESAALLGKRLHRHIVETVGVRKVHLVGYSAGGVVATEVARSLGTNQVGFLGLIEAPIHLRHWSLPTCAHYLMFRRRVFARKLKAAHVRSQAAEGAERRRAPDRPRTLGDLVTTGARHLAKLIYQRYGDVASDRFMHSFPAAIQGVRDATIRAMAHECPGRFEGSATYFKTHDGDHLMCDPQRAWGQVLPAAEYTELPGKHASIMSPPYVQRLADEISARLRSIAAPASSPHCKGHPL